MPKATRTLRRRPLSRVRDVVPDTLFGLPVEATGRGPRRPLRSAADYMEMAAAQEIFGELRIERVGDTILWGVAADLYGEAR